MVELTRDCRSFPIALLGLAVSLWGGVESLQAQVTVRGRVLSSGQPVAGAIVADAATGLEVRSDSGGRFEIRAPAASQLTLVVRALGFRPDTAQISLAGAGPIVHDFRLSASALPQLLPEVSLK